MKAIKVIEPFKVEIVDVPKPVIEKKDDVIIRITSGGICGSDIGIYNGTNSLATYPRLIGHEFGGIVTEVGEAVTAVKPGDKVAVDPVRSCGHCYACRIGRHNVCSTLEVMGVHRDGGFAEYVSAPEANVHLFHKDFDESYLGLVEPFTIGVEVNRRGQITKGDKVIVITIGSDTAYVNGSPYTLDSPAFVENDRTYTPVRFIAENLDADVGWDQAEQQVTITPKN